MLLLGEQMKYRYKFKRFVYFPKYISKNLVAYYLSMTGLGKREVIQPFVQGKTLAKGYFMHPQFN